MVIAMVIAMINKAFMDINTKCKSLKLVILQLLTACLIANYQILKNHPG